MMFRKVVGAIQWCNLGQPPKIKPFLFGRSLPNMWTHPPQGFCAIWVRKGEFRGDMGGLDLVWESATPPTHIWERFPKKTFFWEVFPISVKLTKVNILNMKKRLKWGQVGGKDIYYYFVRLLCVPFSSHCRYANRVRSSHTQSILWSFCYWTRSRDFRSFQRSSQNVQSLLNNLNIWRSPFQ